MCVVDVPSGRLLQTLGRTHTTMKRGMGGLREKAAVAVAVSSVVCCEGGMLTAGLDGGVRHHPLALATPPAG